ncbi:MAG: PIG-L family deacetylase [Acidobacteria bacterium]|nr:PIG-L family deacetylase [Acidobacteriota bacterium]
MPQPERSAPPSRVPRSGEPGRSQDGPASEGRSLSNERTLAGRTVIAIFAHPDDESLACGGTLARLADAGARVVLICASRGERGSLSDRALLEDGDLAGARARELREAARILGVGARAARGDRESDPAVPA